MLVDSYGQTLPVVAPAVNRLRKIVEDLRPSVTISSPRIYYRGYIILERNQIHAAAFTEN